MAFTSETVIKFGSTAVSFAVATLLNYSIRNEKAGAFDYRRKENISFDGYFSNRESSVPISEHFRQIKLLLESSTDFVEIFLNDKSYGKARFLNYSFPTSVNFDENSVRFTKFTITLEVIKDDSSNTFASANLPAAVGSLTNIWYKLKDFSEAFSFSLQDDGNFLASHRISFGYDNIDKASDISVVSDARSIANTFFAQGLDSLSGIRSFYSSTNFQLTNTDYGSSLIDQTVDLINFNFSYSKQYTVFSDNGTNTTETLLTDIIFNPDGLIEVVEKGRIKGKGSSFAAARANAISKLNANISSAYTRCNSAFNRYFSNDYSRFAKVLPKYNSSDTLKSNPISITKDLTETQPEIGYEIRFTTNAAYADATTIHTYSIVLTKDAQGIYNSSINGSIKLYTNKNKSFNSNLSTIKSIIDANSGADDLTRINPYYLAMAGSGSFSGIKTNTSINHLKFGVETTYTKSYSNSPTLNSSGLVRQLVISENTNLPVNRYSNANIPGSWNNVIGKIERAQETIYQTTQLTEGVKSISIDMKINRNQLYPTAGSNTNHATVFGKIKDLFSAEMLHKNTGRLFGITYPQYQYAIKAFGKIYNENLGFKKNELTYFMDNLTLSIDNNYNLKASIEYKFLVKKEKLTYV
jgi:hypothetical protein